MLDAIATPFGWLMMRLYELTDNFGWAIILFAIVVALVLLPFLSKPKPKASALLIGRRGCFALTPLLLLSVSKPWV